MSDRKHCTECDLAYSDEASHELVHRAVVAASAPSADPATTGETPLPPA